MGRGFTSEGKSRGQRSVQLCAKYTGSGYVVLNSSCFPRSERTAVLLYGCLFPSGSRKQVGNVDVLFTRCLLTVYNVYNVYCVQCKVLPLSFDLL